MSRHHMTLPPITYLPLPKAKPAERRTNVGRVFKRGSSFATKDIDEEGETDEASGVRTQVTPLAGRSDREGSSEDDDLPKRNPRSAPGSLHEKTLTVLLQVQEQAYAYDEKNYCIDRTS